MYLLIFILVLASCGNERIRNKTTAPAPDNLAGFTLQAAETGRYGYWRLRRDAHDRLYLTIDEKVLAVTSICPYNKIHLSVTAFTKVEHMADALQIKKAAYREVYSRDGKTTCSADIKLRRFEVSQPKESMLLIKEADFEPMIFDRVEATEVLSN